MPSYWTCRKCRYRNRRTASKRCAECGSETKPKRRPPKHRAVLEQMAYGDFAVLSVLIHGGAPHACGCCGAERPEGGKRLHRDHDHRTGEPRGILCFRCNSELIRQNTLAELERAVAYLKRVDRFRQHVQTATYADELRSAYAGGANGADTE